MKNNHPKLKWWQKGALVGFGIALITLIIVVPAIQVASYYPGGPIMILFVELPVLPIFVLVGNFLGTPGYTIIFPSLGTGTFLLTHFISWTLGGIAYAYIFHTIRRAIRGREQIFPVREPIESLPKIRKEKKISVPWKKILIVAVLIAVGATGYLGYHWYKTSQRPAPPKVVPIAPWEVYRNVYSYEEDYWGYEIKYPPDWMMTEYEGVHQAKWTSPRTMLPPLREIFIETSGAFRHGGVYIDTINCTRSESQKEWFEKNPELEPKAYPRPIGKERIGELEFCRMQNIGGDEIRKIGGLGIRYEVFKNGWDYRNTLWVYYNISDDYRPSEDEFQYELDIFKKMLSTFKFIEK